jgi:hypothetical protein
VHWQACRFPLDKVLWQLVCLNDRFALDGLSPPSYGGLLWCFGWGDKPAAGQKVSEKWAHRYRTGPKGFECAKEILLKTDSQRSERLLTEWFPVAKKARTENVASFPCQSTNIIMFTSPPFPPVGKEQDMDSIAHKTIG